MATFCAPGVRACSAPGRMASISALMRWSTVWTDGLHTIQKFSLDGQLLMTLGRPNSPAPKWQGNPFNRPTHVAVSPVTGHLYVSDGYGNSKVHKFSPEGQHLLSWGSPGIDPDQFIRPHNVVI